MSMLTIVLSVLSVLILVIGFMYTLKIAKNTRYQPNGYDTEITEKVQNHPYTKNPVFLAYLILAILVISFIVYYTFTVNW